MATVYLASASGPRGFEQRVAVKLVHPHLRDDEHFAADLIEEAKLSVRIRHPNVVVTLDAGEDESGVFLVMEYVEGDSLGGLLRATGRQQRAMPRAVGMRILCDALDGLHVAHELRDEDGRSIGLVHRDFSPQNILVGLDGVSRLADFGVAKAASRSGHTQTGAVKGKIAYMAPEQARGAPLDRRCDVWAAGAVAWELCAERRLHPANDVSTLLDIVSRPAPRLRSVDVDVSPELDEVVARALAMDPRHRWPTAAAFAAAIRETGVEIATHAEVAELVREVAGARIAARRERVTVRTSARAERASESPPPPAHPAAEPEPLGGSRRIGRWAALAALATAGMAAAAWFTTAGDGGVPAATSEAAPSALATAQAAEPAASEATPEPAAAAAEAAVQVLHLSSDSPIADLSVGGRPVRVGAGATEVEVELEADELGKPLQIEARSASGKRTSLQLPPGVRAGELRFGAAARPGRPKAGDRPLARSPYER
jgi:serine/threonine-protein kinase